MRGTVVVGGAGHNGLVAACYLARAGLEVLVLEQSGRPGGGSRTDATIAAQPDFRFDTHSVAHNILNMTAIPAELNLAGAGLDYVEMDPFAAGFFADGRVVRFFRSAEATLAGLREHDAAEADAYEAFLHRATPLVDVAVAGLLPASGLGGVAAGLARQLRPAWQGVRRAGGLAALAGDLVAPYGALLERELHSDRTRAPVAAFAAHSSAGPHAPGGAFYAFWQAAYHRFGQHHARGGSQALADALVRRLTSYGGRVRCDARIARIDTAGSRVRGVTLVGGERIEADAVVTAFDPATALLGLLDPPLTGRVAAGLRAAHRGNAVQLLVHLAVDRLPGYPGARPGDWNGLQSHVDSLDALTRGFRAAEAGRLPSPPPTYAFTPSALDASLAPPGQHTVYLACPCAPAEVDGGWARHAEPFADAMVAELERHAPGFTSTIVGRSVRTPETMARELLWPGAHPMVLDISLDQLGPLRPTRALAGHRTPVAGLYVSGAGTAPVGGVAGVPGQAAALALLGDLDRKRR